MNHFQFSTVFTNCRKELGVTQEQIAAHVGVSRAAVSKWEKGQSYPDITLLPKLATYFNISIDTLLGYEPQLTKERIIQIYAAFAEQFAQRPYEEVAERIEQLLAEYYSCFPLVLKMAQLYLNYFPKAPDGQKSAERIAELCQRVCDGSTDYSLINEATMLKAHTYILLGKPEQVLAELGEDVQVQFGADQLIATAHMMLGHTDKAKEIMQVSLYQNMLGVIATATESLLMEVDNQAHYDATIARIEPFIELYNLKRININAVLIFYIKATTGYAMQGRTEQALTCLKKYVSLCKEMQFPVVLTGDAYFYLLEGWVQSQMQLANVTPRDEQSIKHDLLAAITQNPVFEVLKNEQEFKSLVTNLAHQLKREGSF